MKISDLIKKLETYKKERGDKKIEFTVSDYFSVEEFHCNPSWNSKTEFHTGTSCYDGKTLRIHLGLGHQYDHSLGLLKQPKISFRKTAESKVYSV